MIEDHIKKAEFEFISDLKTSFSKTAVDPELTWVRNSMRREDRKTLPDGHQTVSDNLSMGWCPVFVDDQVVITNNLRRSIRYILYSSHSSIAMMTSEAELIRWPEKKNDIEYKVKDCTPCFASGENTKNHLPEKTLRKK